MRPPPVRLLIAAALAVASIGVAASGVLASTDLAACTLHPAEGDAPAQLGTILESVATTGPQDVWVVGSHVVGGVSTAYAERWDGAGWTVQDLDLPPGPTSISSLYDVTAFGPDDVWAVGAWMGEDPLIRHWDGESWSSEQAPTLSGTERILTAIDGTGPNDLWAVGQQRIDNQMQAVVLHRSADGWSTVPPPPDVAVLHDIAMLQPGVPTVAGWSIGPQGWAEASIATREAGAWTSEKAPAAPGRNVFLTGLAFGHPGSAWAVGFSNEGPNGDAPVVLRRSGEGWRTVAIPDQGGSVRLASVATSDAGTVVVGQASTGGLVRALALRADGEGWSAIPGAGDQPPDALAGVTLDGDAVWAVGRHVVVGGTYGIPSARVYSCG